MTLWVVVKPFQPRTNISKVFLFPRLYYGESIIDFEKSMFFRHEVILTLIPAYTGAPKGHILRGQYLYHGL